MIAVHSASPVSLMKGAGGDGHARMPRVTELFSHYEGRVFEKTHGMFRWLLLLQWAFGVLVALVWSPRAWTGAVGTLHPHLMAAVGLGGLLVVPPLLLIKIMPQSMLTRHVVAVAQMGFSGLLVHLTGGRIETHFHVFGSLAFLALYRDWRVLITATIVVATDHLLRGLYFAESIYGVPYATLWRTVEHATWVIFEVVVLAWACTASRREMWEICQQQDANEKLLGDLENRVRERTKALEVEIAEREKTAHELSQSEERYRTFVNNLPVGVFKTTRTGEVKLANPHLLEMLKLPADLDLSRVDMTSGAIFSHENREAFWTRLETDRELRGFETSLRASDGTTIDVVMNARYRARPGSIPDCEGTLEDVTARKKAAREFEVLHQQLVTASRQAGMADVATGVLHNVGNVLTSVNITVQDVLNRLTNSRLSLLRQVAGAFRKEQPRLAEYLTTDPSGRQIPELVVKLSDHLEQENQRVRGDVESLIQHVEHIRKVIMMQQDSARLFGVTEKLTPAQLFEDALKLVGHSYGHHDIVLERDFQPTPSVNADRHKVLQILVNLLKNAKDAVVSLERSKRIIRVKVLSVPQGVALSVIDSGVGIAPEVLTRIFQHGFTTKASGHGFGLHSAILAAREMGGDLSATSAGKGQGASFTLTLPLPQETRS